MVVAARHAKAIRSWRPRSDDPEFVQILRNQEKPIPSGAERRNRVDRNVVLRVRGLRTSRQDVGVEKNSHSPRPA